MVDVLGYMILPYKPKPSLPRSVLRSQKQAGYLPDEGMTDFSLRALVNSLGIQQKLADHCASFLSSGDIIGRTSFGDHVKYGILLKCPHLELLHVLWKEGRRSWRKVASALPLSCE
jgi:hypothetical protein